MFSQKTEQKRLAKSACLLWMMVRCWCRRGWHGPIAKSLYASLLARPATSLSRDALLFGPCHPRFNICAVFTRLKPRMLFGPCHPHPLRHSHQHKKRLAEPAF